MRNLKTFGPALIAAIALSAMAASAVSANTAVVNGGPSVSGVNNLDGNTDFTGLAGLQCKTGEYAGAVENSTITLTPVFYECITATNAPVTVTVNGCAYQFTLGDQLESHKTPVKLAKFECPSGKKIEIHIYADAEHNVPICTTSIGAQQPTSGLQIEDETAGVLQVLGTVSGISSTIGGHCLTTPPFVLQHTPIPSPVASTLHVDMYLLAEGGLSLATQG
jgi:hypothetical protein